MVCYGIVKYLDNFYRLLLFYFFYHNDLFINRNKMEISKKEFEQHRLNICNDIQKRLIITILGVVFNYNDKSIHKSLIYDRFGATIDAIDKSY